MKIAFNSTAIRQAIALCVTVTAAIGVAPAQDAAAPQKSAPASATLEQRLERIGDQLEKQREASHVPGFAIAIVKGDQVILSRGFGLRDIENSLPVTDETLFAIGSTTKAFTATLVGMLIDDGKMSWDDSPRQFLPDFHLSDAAADEKVTIRDLLCHRVGLANNDLLWYSGGADRAAILQTVAGAKLIHPFRENFNYNNVMFLAAGEAAGRAGGSDWDALIKTRIFQPLGMTRSDTSVKVAKQSPHLSKGYDWDEDKSQHQHKPMRDLDNIAPAGSINSCAADMAQWVRMLLSKGALGDKRLVSAERIDDTWTTQIEMSPEVGYGKGWMIRKWQGRRLIEHSGGIDGFGAHVALLPDEPGGGVGLAIFTNVTSSALQPMSVEIVFDNLLNDPKPDDSGIDVAEVQPYLGKYRFDVLKTDVTVLMQNGKLAVDVPGQMVYELKPPDESGKRYFAITDQIAVSFDRDEKNEVVGLRMYQAGLEFECPREGYVPPVEISAGEAREFLGLFHSAMLKSDLKVMHRNGRLAVDVPGQIVFDLHAPDSDGWRAFRAKKSIKVKFNEDENGAVTSMSMIQDGLEMQLPRVDAAPADDALPSLDEVLSMQMKAYGTENLAKIKNIRMTGTLKFVHQGLTGAITLTAAGLDRYRQELDFGKFGYITSAVDGDRGWSDSAFGEFDELTGEYLEQARLQHPLVIAADWRTFFNDMHVERVDAIDGKKVYVLILAISKDVSCTSFIDAETGLLVKDELAVRHKGAGPIKTTITYHEYREIEGVKLPMRYSISNDINGEMAAHIEKVETNVDLPADTFTLKPRRR